MNCLVGFEYLWCTWVHLGDLFDDQISWCFAAPEAMSSCPCLLVILCQFCELTWSNSQRLMLRFYHDLTPSHILYALPLLPVAIWRWESLKVLHWLALWLCLGAPSFASCTVTLVGAEEMPLHLHSLEHAHKHFVHLHRTPLAVPLWRGLPTQLGSIWATLCIISLIGYSGDVPNFLPRHKERLPLQLYELTPGLWTKTDAPQFIACQFA